MASGSAFHRNGFEDEAYFEKRSPAFHFFAAMPFGFTAEEMFSWVHFGGGQELWDALSAQFGIKSLLCSSTGCQMGGWFTRAIDSAEGFRGLRLRPRETAMSARIQEKCRN